MTAAAPALDHFDTNASGMAHCPAHEDRQRSLSVKQGKDGRALIRCHAGCPFADVMAAAGLPQSAAFVPDLTIVSGEPEAIYQYHDADGRHVYDAVRWGKGHEPPFTMRGPNGEPSVKGIERVPYRLPELLAAKPEKGVVIVEGEKDVDRLRSLGIVATCNPNGAGQWRDDFARYFTGRKVRVIADHDEPGAKHAAAVLASVASVTQDVAIVALPGLPDKKGADVSDWLEAGHTADELREILLTAPPTVSAAPSRFEWLHEVEVPDTDAPMVLEPFILDEGPAILFGDGDTGKSAFALVLALSVASGRDLIEGLRPTLAGPVMWIDYESQRRTTRRRQRRIGYEAGILYVPGLRPLHEDVDELARIAHEEGVVLAVVDSVVAAVGGKVSPKDPEAPNLYGQAINAIAPRSLGLGHVPKDQADDGAKPFGSAYWHNVARLTWNARREPDEDRHAVRLYNRKRNDGARFEPYEIELDWSDGGLRVRTGRVGLKAQIVDILADGPLPVIDIAAKLGKTDSQTRTTLTRQRGLFVCEPGPPAVWRLA